MKKSKLVVAVFTVIIAAASFAGAETLSVDFDRGSFRTMGFMEAVKTSDAFMADNAAGIVPVPATALNAVSTTVYKLAAPALQKLRQKALTVPEMSKDFLQLLNYEKVIVLHDNNNIFLTTQAGESYYVLFESSDKELMKLLSEPGTGVVQVRLLNKGKVKICKEVIKILWKWVKEAWVAYEITEEVCSWEDDGDTPGTNNENSPNNNDNGGQAPGCGTPGSPCYDETPLRGLFKSVSQNM